ncbi:Fic family protein [Pedobacter immunditicola]|uniref:Fic family protein n=1 Tax=Pedobacter immunditicola TaxID=3133440 RepID=UPI0030B513A4
MTYSWQHTNWPQFTYSVEKLPELSFAFAQEIGLIEGLVLGLNEEIKQEALLEILILETIKTSEIEGEYLSREDVMSSIKNNLGLQTFAAVKDKSALGIGKLMSEVKRYTDQDLNNDMLCSWHQMLFMHHPKIKGGFWRTGAEPMQVVSGAYGRQEIHYEAPPSDRVPAEMDQFIKWYHQPELTVGDVISKAILKSAIAHLYFESIHPFEDGNGRIGRVLAEFTLSQGLRRPVILSLSKAIEKQKKQYYEQLKQAQRSLDITAWVYYFAQVIIEAQIEAKELIYFTLRKAKFFDRFQAQLNERSFKVVNRMFNEGPAGFEGAMTAMKYMAITKTSKATATRDLQYLQEIGAFKQEGAGRSVRYQLNLNY